MPKCNPACNSSGGMSRIGYPRYGLQYFLLYPRYDLQYFLLCIRNIISNSLQNISNIPNSYTSV